jgi:DNA polymerase III delta prime subunit
MEVQDYFNNGRSSDKRELKLTKEAIDKASDLFPNAVMQKRWPYELSDGEKTEIPFEKSAPGKKSSKLSYSHSTNAMILFSLIASSGQAAVKCPLIPNVTLIDPFDFLSNKSIYNTVWNELKSQIKKELKKTKTVQMSYSTTFGVNDPLTLSWLIEIERSNVFNVNAKSSNIKDDLIKIANLQIKRILKKQSSNSGRMPDWLIWGKYKQRYSIDHGFLALRFVQLIKSLDALQGKPHDGGSNWFAQYFHNRIHEQLSKYEIRDGDFDAAELVFALEGLLLLKPLSISRALLDRLFHVITESQNRNPYWRPVKPIVATPQGRVLFPLSVETASSLLRCCSLIEDSHNDPFFSQNVDLFRRYSEWLRSRISSGTAKYPILNGKNKAIAFFGWHSEHVHIHPGIHLWETANVLLYFHYYSLMLEKHIAEKSLEAAHLNEEYPWTKKPKFSHIKYWTEERKTIEPISGTFDKKLQPYLFAKRHIISPRTPNKHQKQFQDEMAFSIVLYGPPGTGKTLFAEELCKSLTWPLVTVSPTDFIIGGESEVEARAKIIFEVLEDQFNKIILLDEIDRMIIDRSSEGYARQGDFFQFMTPSMLTKLRNLRKKKRIIFIIATNYKERIDPAAIRKGRIDAHLLMSPPNKEGRIEFFKQLILRKITDDTAKNDFKTKSHKILDEIANLTGLNTYSEISGIFDEAIAGLNENEKATYNKVVKNIKSLLPNNMGTKNISLTSYKSRFESDHSEPKTDPFPQKPFLEFFLLVFIKIENGSNLDDKEQKILKIALQKFTDKEDKDWQPTKGELTKLKKRLKSNFPEIKGFIDAVVDQLNV